MNLPVAPERALRDHLTEWLENSRRKARVKLVRAQPVWTGDAVLTVAGHRVHVAEGVSGLAALEAIREVPQDEYVVVLTSLGVQELGSAVWVEAEGHEVANLDEWDSVPSYFGVRDKQTPKPVRALGSWVPETLAVWRPERGFLRAPGGVLSARHVVRALLAALLGVDRGDDLEVLSTTLAPFDDPGVKERLRSLNKQAIEELAQAASAEIDPSVGMVLRATGRSGNVSAIAVGLVLAELWPVVPADVSESVTVDPETAAARVRVERYLGIEPSAVAAARYGAAARTVISRWLISDRIDALSVLDQAEAICADLGWAAGAVRSSFLFAGLHARVASFAARLREVAQAPSASASIAVDEAFRVLKSHEASGSLGESLATAEMAVRGARWLVAESPTPRTFSTALVSFEADGAWVERALGRLWSGDTDVELAQAYSTLAHAIQTKRRAADAFAAEALSRDGVLTDEVIPIEFLLEQRVVPLSSHNNVLLLVLDGMSVSTASTLIPEITRSGWVELVRADTKKRDVAVAMLPTVTEFSRTSLFAGEPTPGNQQVEKSRFAAVCKGVLFHKDDLRSDAGHALPPAVTSAIVDPKQKIVAAVLNTIDDALASADVDSLQWSLSSISNLQALLGAAAKSGRTVILTSDHGHVVERGGELRSIAGSPARWRTAESGPMAEGEVLLTGPRVLSSGGSAVLAVHDGLRYASKKAGYHGGASLAELAIPIAVLQSAGLAIAEGWLEAPPQEPIWWNEPLRQSADRQAAASTLAPSKRKRAKSPSVDSDQLGLFPEIDGAAFSDPAGAVTLGQRLCQAPVFQQNRAAAGRHTVDDAQIARFIDTLIEFGGRAHQDTLAKILGVTTHVFRERLTSLRRMLMVNGYEIVRLELDRVTVALDEARLREQFALTG